MWTLLALLMLGAILTVPGRRAGWWPHPVLPEPPLPPEDAATVAELRRLNDDLADAKDVIRQPIATHCAWCGTPLAELPEPAITRPGPTGDPA